jgi:hypothetical protein
MQVQSLARTLRYWKELVELDGLAEPSRLCSIVLADLAAGLVDCSRTNTWAAKLRAALQFVYVPGQEWDHSAHT